MKTKTILILTAVLLHGARISTQAQGTLTPPGPPGAMMKTLQQIEPRTDVQTLPGDANSLYVISQPGSYYLSSNIGPRLVLVGPVDGIAIRADNVTLDLNGFELKGWTSGGANAGARHGITVSGIHSNVVIRQGHLLDWPMSGVMATGAVASAIHDVRVTRSGQVGVRIGQHSAVLGCSVTGNNSTGIETGAGSTVEGCTAAFNGGSGILVGNGGLVHGCTATSNTLHGLSAGDGSTLTECTATGNSRTGINTGSGVNIVDCSAFHNYGEGIITLVLSTVRGCTAYRNHLEGIATSSACLVIGCAAFRNFEDGIQVTTDSTVKDCSASSNEKRGILANGSGSTVIDCTAADNVLIGIDTADACIVRGCTARRNGGNGIEVGAWSTVHSSLSYSNLASGIRAFQGCSIKDCTVSTNVDDGIRVSSNCLVSGNTCEANNYGIYASGNGNQLERNHLTLHRTLGIRVIGRDNLIAKNLMRNNAGKGVGNYNFNVAAQNWFGPVIVNESAVANGQLSGAYPYNHPWANFADPEGFE